MYLRFVSYNLFCFVLFFDLLSSINDYAICRVSLEFFARDSVSLLRFPFLYYVHVFPCEMLLIRRLKRPQSCFSSFCFLVIVVLRFLVSLALFLVAVISLPPRFAM